MLQPTYIIEPWPIERISLSLRSMHPIRELYIHLGLLGILATLRGMIVLNFIKSFSFSKSLFNSFRSLASESGLLTSWQSTWLSAWLLVVKTSFSKFMQNCWKMVATVNGPSARLWGMRAFCQLPFAYAAGAISIFRSINWKNASQSHFA